MLFAVEGGGFFSSSASGYSKGLSLLLLRQRKEDRPMRVSPWSQYQMVETETDLELQLASAKDRLSRGCASFVCFGHTSARLNTLPPVKKVPTHQHDVLPTAPAPEKDNDQTIGLDNGDNARTRRDTLRSSLKRPSMNNEVSREETCEFHTPGENGTDLSGPDCIGRRKVQWTDSRGCDLVEIREFEPSEVGGSDSEYDGRGERACSCVIM